MVVREALKAQDSEDSRFQEAQKSLRFQERNMTFHKTQGGGRNVGTSVCLRLSQSLAVSSRSKLHYYTLLLP